MALHSTLMALVDTELQGVVAGRTAGVVGEAGLPWFDGRWIGGGATYAGLEEYGIDVGLLILVENPDQVLFLARHIRGLGPVEALQGGEPYSTNFILRGLCRGIQHKEREDEKAYYCLQNDANYLKFGAKIQNNA